jgi:hypothetical protein
VLPLLVHACSSECVADAAPRCFSIALADGFIALGSQVASASVKSVVLAGGAGVNMGAQLGGALTASLTPAILGWTASFLVAAGLCLAGITWFLVDPEVTLEPIRKTICTSSGDVIK